mgnify:FL=1
MGKKQLKAYILSRTNGTIQIGSRIYQPATGAVFRTSRKPWLYSDLRRWEEGIEVVSVSEQSMAGAKEAIRKSARQR